MRFVRAILAACALVFSGHASAAVTIHHGSFDTDYGSYYSPNLNLQINPQGKTRFVLSFDKPFLGVSLYVTHEYWYSYVNISTGQEDIGNNYYLQEYDGVAPSSARRAVIDYKFIPVTTGISTPANGEPQRYTIWDKFIELQWEAFSPDEPIGSFQPGPVDWTLKIVDLGVPEPSTWAMMVLGMGAIGGAMRRRNRFKAFTLTRQQG
ncbi:MAG: PEPxxWA-CTERM sorting domain-containing protein [Sphingobium sp.]